MAEITGLIYSSGVNDGEGQVIENALVRYNDTTALTGESGDFTMEVGSAGLKAFSVAALGHMPDTFHEAVPTGGLGVVQTLEKYKTLSGYVMYYTNGVLRPAEGAVVTLGSFGGPPIPLSAVTDSTGKFTLPSFFAEGLKLELNAVLSGRTGSKVIFVPESNVEDVFVGDIIISTVEQFNNQLVRIH